MLVSDNSKFVEWDIINWSKALSFWIQHTSKRISDCRVLEVGSRHGGLSLWLATQGAEVVCTDLFGPSEEAKLLHQKSETKGNIVYASANALDLQYENEFDIVVFKSVLGGIGEDVGLSNGAENQHLAIKNMHSALKPNGELFFAENLSASPLHRFLRKRTVPWAQSWNYPQLSELETYMAGFSSAKFDTVGFLGALGRSERQRKLLGRIDSILFDGFLPSQWHYIAFGVARK